MSNVIQIRPDITNVNSYEERSSTRIREFLRKVQLLEACEFSRQDPVWRGRLAIEALARSFDGGPPCDWSLPECADVLRFLACTEPVHGECYCAETSDTVISAACGLMIIHEELQSAVENAIGASHESAEGE